jgi:hypothetical protein
MLERLVYVSRAAPGATEPPEVARIIRAAHRRNAAAGITGALLCLDGWFAQALEGPAAGLDAVLARLAVDPRHGRFDLRIRERGLCRLFPGQAMALRTGAGLDPGLRAEFGYRPGFPVADFPAAVLVEFMVSACRCHVLRSARPGMEPRPEPRPALDKRGRLS